MKKYPGISPYVFALDNPIRLMDKKGKAPGDPIGAKFLLPNFTIDEEKPPVGSLNIGTVTSKDVQNQNLSVRSSAIGTTSGGIFSGGSGFRGFLNAIQQANSGVAQVAQADQQITASKVNGDPFSMRVTKVDKITTVTLEGSSIQKIETKIETSTMIVKVLAPGQWEPKGEFEGEWGKKTTVGECLKPDINSIQSPELRKAVRDAEYNNSNAEAGAKANEFREGVDKYNEKTNEDDKINTDPQNTGKLGADAPH